MPSSLSSAGGTWSSPFSLLLKGWRSQPRSYSTTMVRDSVAVRISTSSVGGFRSSPLFLSLLEAECSLRHCFFVAFRLKPRTSRTVRATVAGNTFLTGLKGVPQLLAYFDIKALVWRGFRSKAPAISPFLFSFLDSPVRLVTDQNEHHSY